MNNANQNWGFWKTAIIYGLPPGVIVITFMLCSFALFGFHSDASSMAVGFLMMFLAFSLIFFGIRRFKNLNQGGFIKFSKALFLGLAMSLFAALAYVVIWEIYRAVSNVDFIGQYTNHLIELETAKGISAEELSEFIANVKAKQAKYTANAVYRMSVTFSEIFPIGFIVSLFSALVLHKPKFWAK